MACPYRIERTRRQKTNQKRRLIIDAGGSVYNEDIADWSADVSSQALNYATSPYSIGVSSDGVYLLVHGSLSNIIFTKAMSTPWDLSTLGAVATSTAEPASSSVTYGCWFNDDGTKIIIAAATLISEATLSTPYDVSSRGAYTQTTIGSWQGGAAMSYDGLRMYSASVGAGTQTITEYEMTTAYDTTTLAATGNTLDISDKISASGKPEDIVCGSVGTNIFAITDNGEVHQWTMGTANDLSTATYTGQSPPFTLTSTFCRAAFDRTNGRYLYISDPTLNDVWAYESDRAN